VIIVDSGSTDRTLEIAERHGCRIVRIERAEFTFGRSLNMGCSAAQGNTLVFVSGHCIPCDEQWLTHLIAPVVSGIAAYAYGRQVGNDASKYSERQLFRKYFPDVSSIPQSGYFCNNANAALDRSLWSANRFDESLTGLEDLELAKRLEAAGQKIAYVADAPVLHLHDESWLRIKTRYEREALALRRIMPEVHVTLVDAVRYFISAVLLDCRAALGERRLLRKGAEIVMFRLMQYWGVYRGNDEHRKISNRTKEKYFYPR
jgi:glycosyltransferase involved in cell wall biosynthesis